jgi:stage V sporulation protein G
MNITEVRISPAKGGKVRAFASIVIDDCFIVNDLRVIEGREGQIYVTMPARKVRNGQMRDIAHPLNSQTRKQIEDTVLAEFRQAVEHLIVPQQNPGKDSRKKNPSNPLDRLATKLFSDDFWTEDSPGSEPPKVRNQDK